MIDGTQKSGDRREQMSACPTSADLEQFVLCPQDNEWLSGHIEGCPACRERAARIEEDNALLRQVLSATSSKQFVSRSADLQIPGYTILRELHRGGQGLVFLARQESTQRLTAIKVMHEGPFASLADRARFDREVHLLAQLDHPNIITVYDSGRVHGWDYFVMDYVEGVPLDEYVRDDGGLRIPLRSAIALFASICEAVNAAHIRGIIHRDLKPKNIIVSSDGEPHILDFGLSKTEGSMDSMMTYTGQFVGSLPWSSPEQVSGDPGLIDIRTDVYALGVILYQLLTGRFPYNVHGSVAQVADQIRSVDPPPIRNEGADISADLNIIVIRCLAKEPQRRYQSAGELARDLRHYLDGMPIEARRDSTWYVLSKHCRRHWVPLTFATSALVALAIFSVTISFAYQRIRNTERESYAKSIELARMLRDSNIEQGRLQGAHNSVPLAEDLLWREFLMTSTAPPGIESTDAAFWGLLELYSTYPCVSTHYGEPFQRPAIPVVAGVDPNEADQRAVSHSGQWCAIGGDSGAVRVLDREHGVYSREVLRIEHFSDPIQFVDWLEKDTGLLASTMTGRIAVWDLSSDGAVSLRWERNDLTNSRMVDVHPQRRIAATLTNALHSILFIDTDTGETIGASGDLGLLHLRTHAFDVTGRYIAVAQWNKPAVRIFGVPSARPVTTLFGHRALLGDLSVDHRTNFIESVARSGEVKLWELPASKNACVRLTNAGTVLATVVDDGADRIWFADERGDIWITDPQGNLALRRNLTGGTPISWISLSPDRGRLVTCGHEGLVQSWRTDTFEPMGQFASESGLGFMHQSCSSDGRFVAASCEDHRVYVWDLSTEELAQLGEHQAPVSVVEFSPDGRWLASGDRKGKLIIRRGDTLAELFTVQAHQDQMRILIFSPDGENVATAGDDRFIRIWRTRDGSLLHEMESHQQVVYALTYRKDGRILASGDTHGTIIFWDAESGRQLMQLKRHNGAVFCLSFGKSGDLLVSTSDDQSAIIHNLRYLERYVAGNLNAAIKHVGEDVLPKRLAIIKQWAADVMRRVATPDVQ